MLKNIFAVIGFGTVAYHAVRLFNALVEYRVGQEILRRGTTDDPK